MRKCAPKVTVKVHVISCMTGMCFLCDKPLTDKCLSLAVVIGFRAVQAYNSLRWIIEDESSHVITLVS